MKQELLRGSGCLAEVPAILAGQRVLLLTGRSAGATPEVEALARELGQAGTLQHVAFSTPLLDTREVDRVAASIEPRPDAIVAVGGGSIQDLAKCLKATWDCEVATVDELLGEVLGAGRQSEDSPGPGDGAGRVRGHETVHVAVPTTAGTGSEATCFATVYRDLRKESLEDPRLLPAVAVLDPTLLRGVPARVAGPCALDTLSQAIESVASRRATDASVDLAIEAVGLAAGAVLPAVLHRDLDAMARMQLASYRAGQAIQLTRTTLAHGLSYALSAHFGVPHGLAVFLVLPAVVRFNAGVGPEDCLDERGPAHYHARMERLFATLDVADHEALASWAEGLLARLGFSPRLADHGIEPADLRRIVDSALGSARSGNNPRRPRFEDLVDAIRST